MEYCNWVQPYGHHYFQTDCGHEQGKCVRPKQKTCFCGRRVRRFIQDANGVVTEVECCRIKGKYAYYAKKGT